MHHPIRLLATCLVLALPAARAEPPQRLETTSLAAELYRKSQPAKVLRLDEPRPEQEWRDNTARGPHTGDDDACLLSFSLGGDLDVRGYKGIRLFGATRTLAGPKREVSRARAPAAP